MKLQHTASVFSAAILAGRSCDASSIWNDGDLEEFVAYIKDGIKPKKE